MWDVFGEYIFLSFTALGYSLTLKLIVVDFVVVVLSVYLSLIKSSVLD